MSLLGDDRKTPLASGWWVGLPLAERWEFLGGCSHARLDETLWVGTKVWCEVDPGMTIGKEFMVQFLPGSLIS